MLRDFYYFKIKHFTKKTVKSLCKLKKGCIFVLVIVSWHTVAN